MTMLTSIMVILSSSVALVMVPRIYGSWLQFKEASEDGDLDRLINLQTMHNEWVIRHLSMALLALGVVAAIKYLPELESYTQTAAATAIYCVLCFALAFAESIIAQRISGDTTAILHPVKHQKGKRY